MSPAPKSPVEPNLSQKLKIVTVGANGRVLSRRDASPSNPPNGAVDLLVS